MLTDICIIAEIGTVFFDMSDVKPCDILITLGTCESGSRLSEIEQFSIIFNCVRSKQIMFNDQWSNVKQNSNSVFFFEVFINIY